MFLLGAALLILPFAVYFAAHGALYDALYGTILYNLDYAKNSAILYSASSPIAIVKLLIAYSPSFILLLLGIYDVSRKHHRLSGLLWTTTGVITLAWLLCSNGYLHYGLIAIPYLPIAFSNLKQLADTSTSHNTKQIFIMVFYSCFCMAGSFLRAYDLAGQYYNALFIKETETYRQIQSELIEQIPRDERNAFIAYNTNTGLYLQHDIKPCYRLFTFQDWAASRSPSLTNQLHELYDAADATWILVEGNPDTTLISDILHEKYTLIDRREKTFTPSFYSLYRKNP